MNRLGGEGIVMAGSLLAYLYPKIKGSQEDIATYSLNYIVEQSEILRADLTRLFADRLHIECGELLHFSAQVIGAQKERPDIVGIDDSGCERIICEAKFFAALTENQPLGYLKRLNHSSSSGLIFLCPRSRMIGLWKHLCQIIKDIQVENVSDFCVRLENAHMAIISWDELLDSLLSSAEQHAPEAKNDLLQLKGFCTQIESSSFIPFREEDFGVDVAKSMDRYNMVVDASTDILLNQQKYISSTKGYRATSLWSGYVRYMNIGDISLGLWTNRELWKKSTSLETPFWVNVTWLGWTRDQILEAFYNSMAPQMTETDNKGVKFIALEAPVGLTLDETAQFIADQVLHLIEKLLDFKQRNHSAE